MPPQQPDPIPRAPLAYENADFIDSPDGRLLRIVAEYQEPLARFRRERIEDTIVFFGSARFHALDVACKRLELLENTGSATPAPPQEQPATDEEIESGEASTQKLRLAEAAVEMAAYYEDARRLAFLIASWTRTLPGPRHRFVVTSGGGPGIMEAANRGAWEAGAKTIGLNIRLPFEQLPNPYITPELNFEFHYFFMRKYFFAYLAKALVVFPGGFGTLDEMFELLTLAQTHKLAKPMTILITAPATGRTSSTSTFSPKREPSPSRTAISSSSPTPRKRPSPSSKPDWSTTSTKPPIPIHPPPRPSPPDHPPPSSNSSAPISPPPASHVPHPITRPTVLYQPPWFVIPEGNLLLPLPLLVLLPSAVLALAFPQQ